MSYGGRNNARTLKRTSVLRRTSVSHDHDEDSESVKIFEKIQKFLENSVPNMC